MASRRHSRKEGEGREREGKRREKREMNLSLFVHSTYTKRASGQCVSRIKVIVSEVEHVTNSEIPSPAVATFSRQISRWLRSFCRQKSALAAWFDPRVSQNEGESLLCPALVIFSVVWTSRCHQILVFGIQARVYGPAAQR